MKDIKKTEKIRIRKIFRISICVTLMFFVVISTIGVASAQGNVLEGEGTPTGNYFIPGLQFIDVSSSLSSGIGIYAHSPFATSYRNEDGNYWSEISITEEYISIISTDYDALISFLGSWTPSNFPFESSADTALVSYIVNGQTSETNIEGVSSLPSDAEIISITSTGYGGNTIYLKSGSLTPETTPKTGGILSAFSLVISWIVSFVGTIIGIFYANGSLTFLGFLAVAALAFSICFIIFSLIRNFLMFRG